MIQMFTVLRDYISYLKTIFPTSEEKNVLWLEAVLT